MDSPSLFIQAEGGREGGGQAGTSEMGEVSSDRH